MKYFTVTEGGDTKQISAEDLAFDYLFVHALFNNTEFTELLKTWIETGIMADKVSTPKSKFITLPTAFEHIDVRIDFAEKLGEI